MNFTDDESKSPNPVFSDEDLKRWRAMTPGRRIPPFSELQALLARLEAAELVCLAVGFRSEFIPDGVMTVYEAWRIAKGEIDSKTAGK